jgi:hypothetical protein
MVYIESNVKRIVGNLVILSPYYCTVQHTYREESQDLSELVYGAYRE